MVRPPGLEPGPKASEAFMVSNSTTSALIFFLSGNFSVRFSILTLIILALNGNAVNFFRYTKKTIINFYRRFAHFFGD